MSGVRRNTTCGLHPLLLSSEHSKAHLTHRNFTVHFSDHFLLTCERSDIPILYFNRGKYSHSQRSQFRFASLEFYRCLCHTFRYHPTTRANVREESLRSAIPNRSRDDEKTFPESSRSDVHVSTAHTADTLPADKHDRDASP